MVGGSCVTPHLLLCQDFFAEKVNLLCHFGLSCRAGIVSKFLHTPVCPKAVPRDWASQELSPSFPQRYFVEESVDGAVTHGRSHHLPTGCVLNNRIYLPVFSAPKILRARNLDDFRLAQLHGVSRHFTIVQEKLLSWCFPCHQKTGWKRGWEMLQQISPWLQGQIFIFHCVPLEFCRF